MVKGTGDPAYAAATELRDFVNRLYEFLCSSKKGFDRTKWDETGCSYLLATLEDRQRLVDVTGTAPNRKLLATLDNLIKVRNILL